MKEWQERLEKLKEKWRGLELKVRLALIAGVAALVGVILLVSVLTSGPDMEVLFAQLSQEDAVRVEERLRNMGVPYTQENGGTTVLVPKDKVHETRMALASEGLPGGGGVGFEIFDEQRFGESEFSEQVKYHRALEGELSRTISHIAGVDKARVHLVLPKRSVFASEEESASASVVVHLRPGWKLKEAQVDGVVHLVASSVRGLSPDQVTVVDGNGDNLVHASSSNEDEKSARVSKLRSEIERRKQRSVQRLLDRTLGPDKAVARVAADVSLGQQERTEEVYDPETVATRSFEIVEEGPGAQGAGPQGVPGAVSNLPGGEVATAAGAGSTSAARRSERRNFEVTKKTLHAVDPSGRVERLQVAVAVDGYWVTKKGKSTFKPRSKAELARIEKIVARAVGIREDRGDQVTVECVRFAKKKEPLDPLKPFRPYMPYVSYALSTLGVLLLFVMFFIFARKAKKAMKGASRPPIEANAAVMAAGENADPEAAAAMGAGAAATAAMGAGAEGVTAALGVGEQDKAAQAKELQLLAGNLASEDPLRTARVLQVWMAEEPA